MIYLFIYIQYQEALPKYLQRTLVATLNQGRFKNEEHDLIASYARRLAGQGGPASSPDDDLNIVSAGQPGHRREVSSERKEDKNLRLVHELELKNAEIMREIARLRQNRALVRADHN